MKYVIGTLLLISAHVSSAQIFTIKKIEKGEEYVFPLIESSQRPAIAKKMNAVIQTGLGADPNSASPFDSIQNEDEFHYETGAVNDRVLSIIVTGSHTGAGLHITRNVYNFDSRTGALITTDQLFGNEGHARLKNMVASSRTAKLKTAVNDKQYGDQYKNCLAEAANTPEMEPTQILILDHGINFWAGGCLEGTTYDFEADVSQGPYEYSFGQLLPILNAYGYSVFADKPAGPIHIPLHGTVDGKYAISMTLRAGSTPGTIAGMIVYDRVGEPINLIGTMNGNSLTLHEVDASNNPVSNIEVTWDGTKLSGTFMNLKSKKTMAFLAK